MNFDSSADISVVNANVSERSSSTSRARILLIEDDREIAEEVANELVDRAYMVNHVATGSQGAEEARRGRYDLLIIDLLLPGCDGFSIIQELRRDGIQVPVLVVSALGAVNDRVRGLKIGGDDYVTKPFALAGTGGARRGIAAPATGNARNDTACRAVGTGSDRTGRPARRPNDRVVEKRVQAAGVFHAAAGSRGDTRHASGGCLELSVSSPNQPRRCAYRTAAPQGRWSQR